ncbi:unnamed protein product, partial [Vitis vinifera]
MGTVYCILLPWYQIIGLGSFLVLHCKCNGKSWYEYVKRSMPPHFFPSHNKFNETAKQIFTRDHKDMVQKGKEWLGSTATSCSVVATLIATVGFATSSAVPGGTREGSGKPNLEQQPAFHIFAEHERKSFIISNSNTSMKRNEMNFLFSFWFHYSKYAKRK